MVASVEAPVSQKVREWRELSAQDTFDADKRSQANPLLSRAEQLLGVTNQHASATANSAEQASVPAASPANVTAYQSSDTATKQDERNLSLVLADLFRLFGETNNLANPIYRYIGRQIVIRRPNTDDVFASGIQRRYFETDYILTLLNRNYNIRRKDSASTAPQVHIDSEGLLREGPSTGSVTDLDALIDKYKNMYTVVLGSQNLEWDTNWTYPVKSQKIELYRNNFRDTVVIRSSGIPAELNAIRGVIFELWLERKGVMARTPRPQFFKDYYAESSKKLSQNRDADGFAGNVLYEAKAISVDRNPSGEELLQMEDYKKILMYQIPWVRSITDKTVFVSIEYNFTRDTLKTKWDTFLRDTIGGTYWSSTVR
jgi:hypothetical protein